MIDLRPAIYCIQQQKENGTYNQAKIGRIKQDIKRLVDYITGEIVLFKKEESGDLTIEKPMSKEQIKAEQQKNSLITTICTMVSVPSKGYIEEIVF